MPGTHLVINHMSVADSDSMPRRAMESLLHLPNYRGETVTGDNGIFLGYTCYPGYPVEVHRQGERILMIEGDIHDRPLSTLVSELTEITGALLDGSEDTSILYRWMHGVDGEFVVTAIDPRSGRFLVFNDPLGRLPLYRFETEQMLIVSREIRFIGELAGWPGIDRGALAQTLLICFPLEEKTLYRGVRHIPPASILGGEASDPGAPASVRLRLSRTEQRNLGTDISEGQDIGDLSEELARLFRKAVARRASGHDLNILSLSGGLDSRTVLSGLLATGSPFRSATYLDHYATASDDLRVAGILASRLDLDWTLMRLSRPTGSDALKLLRMKSGANYLGMSYSLRYFSSIISQFGDNVVFFAGEGGGQVLPDIRPARNFTSLRSLALFLVEENRIVPLETVSKITGMAEEEILSDIISTLESYPEEDLRMKYVHFLIFGRCLKWLSEGEDRNRCFFRTASPLLSPGFFDLAISSPWKNRSRYRLYRSFLGRLSEAASNIEISGWRSPPSSTLAWIYLLGKDIYRRLPSGARTTMRRRLKSNFTSIGAYRPDSPTYRCLMEQLDRCSAVAGYLSVDEAKKNAGMLNKMGFDHLLTVTSVIEETATGKSTIEKYSSDPLL